MIVKIPKLHTPTSNPLHMGHARTMPLDAMLSVYNSFSSLGTFCVAVGMV